MKNKTALKATCEEKFAAYGSEIKVKEALVEIPRLTYAKIAPLLPVCIDEMQNLSKVLRKAVASIPSGNLRVSPHHGSYQYFLVSKKDKKGKYISKENIKGACLLAQKKYYDVVADVLDRGSTLLSQVWTSFSIADVEKCFEKQGPGRQALLTAVFLSDNDYAKRWSAVPYQGLSISEESAVLYTAKGERVRSKSEVIIADMLNRMNVPYRYECPLLLSGRVVYPDFTCLNVRTRDEFIWEHFGRMNDQEYQEKMLKKIDGYSAEGLVFGKNLIYTMESSTHPVNQKMIEQMIHNFLK